MYRKLFFLIYYVVASLDGFAQVSIGDKVPDVVFNEILNYPNVNARLSDFKGKYVILDFWNKSCAPCIAAFPELKKLQTQFNNDIQIILVTMNNKEQLEVLFKNSSVVKKSSLPMVINDTVLSQKIFKYTSVPYQVWIDREGVVKMTTDGGAATFENIQDLVEGRPLKGVSVREDLMDIDLNGNISLLNVNRGKFRKQLLYYCKYEADMRGERESSIGKESNVNEATDVSTGVTEEWPHFKYYSLLMRHIKGLSGSGGGALYDSISGKVIGMRALHSPLFRLYSDAYNAPTSTKIIIEDGDDFFKPKAPSSIQLSNWIHNYLFSYEVTLPNYSLDNYREVMKKDLYRVFGRIGKWEDRDILCRILYRINNKDLLQSKGGEAILENTKSEQGIIITNTSFEWVKITLAGNMWIKDTPFFIDETNIDEQKKVDMLLPSNLSDINALQKSLNKYGLGIKEEIRRVKVLVLEKK